METSPEKKDKPSGRGGRGRDTIFRIAARNQIELIAIADNKSNMIIGICVVLISLVVVLLGSGFAIQGTPIGSLPALVIPMCVLLIFALSAAICAIMAAKPKIIEGKPEAVHSLLFFQNIYKKTQEEYLNAMHTLLTDKTATYDQIIVDMYNNGIVLHRKYRMLSIAYMLFMTGLVLSVFTFLVATAIQM